MRQANYLKSILFIITCSFYFIANLTFAQTTLEEATIQSIHSALKNHKITCVQLVNGYINRIKQYNITTDNKPPFNAIARINTNALEQAKKLDEALAKGQFKGALFCIPVLLKDNIDSYDSVTASGSIAMLDNQPIHDAFITEKLRNAGAVILGKGTMDEFASGISGISGGNGRTGNAYNTYKNSGGSSAGPAVAVSVNFTALGIGTDNSGSVRIPAAFNGIYGLRPSTGLISQSGIFPRGNMDGVAGPLTRSVEDLAILLDVIAQPDAHDAKTLNIQRPTTYTAYLDPDGLKGKRIGIVQQVEKIDTFKNMSQDTQKIFHDSLKKMEKMGATFVPDIKLAKFNLDRQNNEAGEGEDINSYLASYPAVRKNYRDICESDRTRVFGSVSDCLQFIAKLPKKLGAHYEHALKIFSMNKAYVEEIMNNYQLDALLIPVSTTGSATYDSQEIRNESVSSNAGLPGITINLGYTAENMPIGFELIGKQFAEGKLIGMAYAYEKHSPPRIIPSMPDANNVLGKFDIPSYNNLLMQIGYTSYKTVLIKSKSNDFSKDLTADKFIEVTRSVANNFDKDSVEN